MGRVDRAAPPRAPAGARGQAVRREGPVEGRVPLGGDSRKAGGQRVGHRGLQPTTGPASQPPAPRSRSDGGPPLVVRPARAAPPHLSVRPGEDAIRRQSAVPRRMPLGRDPGKPRGQGVPGRQPPVAAVRASGRVASRAVPDRGPPRVVAVPRALPPDGPIGPGARRLRRARPVPGGVPLGGDGGVSTGQRGGDRDPMPRAERAAHVAGAPGPARDGGGPHVVGAPAAPPPDRSGEAHPDVLRPQASVPRRMPLGRDRRGPRGERVVRGALPRCAVGAASVGRAGLGDPVRDDRAPDVDRALAAPPPDRPPGQAGDVRRPQPAVPGRVPFGGQGRVPEREGASSRDAAGRAEAAPARRGHAGDRGVPRPGWIGGTAPPGGTIRPWAAGRARPVPGRVPVGAEPGHDVGELPGVPAVAPPPAAEGTARDPGCRPPIGRRGPDVPVVLPAAPPDRLAGARRDVVRGQPLVQARVPLGGEQGEAHRQRVGDGRAPSRAERAPDAEAGPVAHDRAPFVIGPGRAPPPDGTARPRGDVRGPEAPVPGRVPLGREPRVSPGQRRSDGSRWRRPPMSPTCRTIA
jgi:hypothetical protein